MGHEASSDAPTGTNKNINLILSDGSFFSVFFLEVETLRSKQWPTTWSRQKLTNQSDAPWGQLWSLRQDFAQSDFAM